MKIKFPLSFATILLAIFLNTSFAKAFDSEPIAWWNFNNQSEVSSGLVRDAQGSHNGQNINGTAKTGYDGGAIYFDLSQPSGQPGSGNGDGFKAAGFPELTKLTITFRMKTDGSTNANQSVILAQSISPTYGEFNIQYLNGVLGVGAHQGSASATLTVDQNYHYYAVNYDGRNIYIYVDGEVKGFATASGTGKVTADTWSFVSNGSITSSNNVVNKLEIDNLKVYDRVLNDAEVAYENNNDELCYADTWSCPTSFGECSSEGVQTRTCTNTFECPLVVTPVPDSQACTPPPPSCTSDTWSCTNWNQCSSSGSQTRTCTKTSNCDANHGAEPATQQSCTASCSADTWECDAWSSCSANGQQTRSCHKTFDCSSVATPSPATSASCTAPTTSCSTDLWECGSWGECSSGGTRTRVCEKTLSCPAAGTPAPTTQEVCNQNQSICTEDTWSCDPWNACSVDGAQSRTCSRTFDCPSVVTSEPLTNQQCQSFVTTPPTVTQEPTTSAAPPVTTKPETELVSRLKGFILLQVQQHGEAWYVNPVDGQRYYMRDGNVAYGMMRNFSLGITNADLLNVPEVSNTDEMSKKTSICTTSTLSNRLKGKILLQVQEHGEAWYVDPNKCYRIYMKDGTAAYSIMRYLSLGITNADLEKISEGTIAN